MKQRLLLLALFCLMAGMVKAATVSGTVTNSSTSAPIVNQKVYIFDSLAYYMDSTLTNSSGSYSFTIPSVVPNGDLLMVSTSGCGTYRLNTFFWTGTSVTSNFSMCGSGATYALHGTVSLGGAANNGPTKLWLIRMDIDSVLMDTTLTAIDSFTTSVGGTYNQTYASIPYGILFLKAALQPSHSSYSSYLPTYYTNSLVWSSATILGNARFAPATATNINLVGGSNPGGPGFIGGSVAVGANKGAAIGDPLANRILILTNNSGQAVAYTYSNASGQFSFPNLAYGTYKIFGDAWGKKNPVLTVTISASNPSISNVRFEENNKKFEGHIGNLGVGGTPFAGVNVYPNPANDFVALTGLASINGDKTVVLSNVTGATITKTEVKAGANATISTTSLPAGMYMLQLHTAEGATTYKFVKE